MFSQLFLFKRRLSQYKNLMVFTEKPINTLLIFLQFVLFFMCHYLLVPVKMLQFKKKKNL